MNCRALISYATSLVIILFIVKSSAHTNSLSSSASNPNQPVIWESLSTEAITIQSESSAQGDVYSTYPPLLQTIYTRFLSWEPRVNSGEQQKDSCRLSFSSPELKGKVSELSQFLATRPECAYLDESKNQWDIQRVLRALSVEFDVSNTKHFRKAMFKIPARTAGKYVHLRGLFGLHDDKKPRPLVILRLGVHGNVDEFLAERFLGKIIYEDFGFNFLVLENLTSHGYLALDNPITFGGVDEGLQTFEIMRMLQGSKFKSLISETHLMGVSLGAHGVFLTQLMDQANDNTLKSVTVFCPVINLVETMGHQKQAEIKAGIIDLWNYRRLQAVRSRITELDPSDWWMTAFDFKPRYVPQIMNYLEKNQIRPSIQVSGDVKWPAGLKNHFESARTFSELNNFWPYYEKLKSPSLIVTTPNDLLVPAEINTGFILRGQQQGFYSEAQIVELERSIHCGLVTDYRWDFIVDLLKAQWGNPLHH